MDKTIYRKKINKVLSFDQFIEKEKNKPTVRFITSGSVDDGKSTLIGRLLYDSKVILEDQLEQLKSDSSTNNNKIKLDFSLLLDGLDDERSQGITIDVAYRYFSTKKCKFIVADTPGHEQYTRNMVTGASTASFAIVLTDVMKGITNQTKRHIYLASLLGVKNVILAVNKMDLIKYNKNKFFKIEKDFSDFIKATEIDNFITVPVSAIYGDNIVNRSKKMFWYKGPTIIQHLETAHEIDNNLNSRNFSLSVQTVNKDQKGNRYYQGSISSGKISKGDEVIILPNKTKAKIKKIITFEGNLKTASKGDAISIMFDKEVDCSRGDVIFKSSNVPKISHLLNSYVIWMDKIALVPGLQYYLKLGHQVVSASLSKPKYEVDMNTLKHIESENLKINSVGCVQITTDRPIVFDHYKLNKDLGGYILIDKIKNTTIAAGIINFGLRRAENINWQKINISREHHANIKGQRPVLLWMTGISGAGKSTIANAVEKKLADINLHTFILDGDNIRKGLNKDLGFKDEDRIENIRRVGEVGKLMIDAGLIVIAALISPFKEDRDLVRSMIDPNEFIEVYIDTPLSVTEKRDVKGLYAKAKSGKLSNFTGVSSPYQPPSNPEIHIKTLEMSIEEASEKIVKKILERQHTSFKN